MAADDDDQGYLRDDGGYGDVGVKYAVPVALHVLDRPRLYARLEAASESSATLVASSAGWGKTLLVSSWLAAKAVGPVAWMSVGPEDDDHHAFWRAVATSLGAVVGAPVDTVLRGVAADRGSAGDPYQRVVDAMYHAVDPTVLVLDDLHEITSPEVHASLLRLIETPIPGLRLILSTRRDPPWPLHRLRLAGLLDEVPAAELAFSPDEGRELFTRLGVELTTGQLDLLLDRTGGWAAGLRLAALELRGAGVDATEYIASFSGDDRTVTAYLTREVLGRQSAPVLRFLQSICIVDAVCAELADALTGDDDGAEMLTELSASHLFVDPVGANGRWFRLHGVVADVLRSRMPEPRARRDLHRRAAQWYRRQSLPVPAIRLALRGGLLALAAELVGIHVVGFALRGEGREIDAMLSTVARDELLPHPELAAGLAAVRMVYGSREEVAELLSAAAARVDTLPALRRRRVRMVLDLIRIAGSRSRGDLHGVAAVCRHIPDDPGELAALGLSGWDLIRVLLLSNRGTAELWLGELDAAETHLRATVEAEPAGSVVLPQLNALAHLALLACERGDLTSACSTAHDAITRATAVGSELTPQVVTAYLALAWVHLDRGEPTEVEQWLRKVDEVEASAPEPHVQLTAAVLLARHRAVADPGAAQLGLQADARRLACSTLPLRLQDRCRLVEAELAALLDEPELAGSALAELHAPRSAEAMTVAAAVRLHQRDLDGAEAHLTAVGAAPTTLRTRVTADILRALSASVREDGERALRSLDRALLAAAPQEMRRPFLDRAGGLGGLLARRVELGTGAARFAVELLSRMGRAAPSTPHPLRVVAPLLTPRETVVLRYLASTLTNSEIATELSVSINTVKTHQQTAYRKLGVTGRREAVHRGRELHIL